MARRRKSFDGLPLRKLEKLVSLLDEPCPQNPAAREMHFQAIRQAASNVRATGNLGLLDELTFMQRKRLKAANTAQRESTKVKPA